MQRSIDGPESMQAVRGDDGARRTQLARLLRPQLHGFVDPDCNLDSVVPMWPIVARGPAKESPTGMDLCVPSPHGIGFTARHRRLYLSA